MLLFSFGTINSASFFESEGSFCSLMTASLAATIANGSNRNDESCGICEDHRIDETQKSASLPSYNCSSWLGNMIIDI